MIVLCPKTCAPGTCPGGINKIIDVTKRMISPATYYDLYPQSMAGCYVGRFENSFSVRMYCILIQYNHCGNEGTVERL
jgi:hypothetical protein